MKLADYIADSALETQGAECPFEDVVFIIAATGNIKHTRAMQRLAKQHNPAKVRNDPALQQQIAVESMAEAILIGWRGQITAGDGRVLDPGKIDDRREVLKSRTLREWIAEQSAITSNFQRIEDAADVDAVKS